MIHFTEYETDIVAVIAIFNQPEAIKLAQESTETWAAIQFTIAGHGDTLIYKDRETFLKLIERAEGQRAEILPHLQQWAKDKGLPPLSEFSTIVSFTSKMPDGIAQIETEPGCTREQRKEKQMKPSGDDPLSDDGPTSIEPQHAALESAPMPTGAENLDTDFDDPRLAAELKKSQQTLEDKFVDLERHLDAASRLAKQIRALVDERLR